MTFYLVILLIGFVSAAEQCRVNRNFRTTCDIGGLIITEPDENINVTCNQIYKKEQFANAPVVIYPQAKQGETYTLIMIDPEAPCTPKIGCAFLHWIPANIRGEDFAFGNLSKAKTIIGYMGPAPPRCTRPFIHRYIFLVFRHNDTTTRITYELTDRTQFNLANYLRTVQSQDGVQLCGPEAALQFRSKFA